MNRAKIIECAELIDKTIGLLNFLHAYFGISKNAESGLVPGLEEYDDRESVHVNKLFHDEISRNMIVISIMIQKIEDELKRLETSKSPLSRIKFLYLSGIYLRYIKDEDVKRIVTYIEEYSNA